MIIAVTIDNDMDPKSVKKALRTAVRDDVTFKTREVPQYTTVAKEEEWLSIIEGPAVVLVKYPADSLDGRIFWNSLRFSGCYEVSGGMVYRKRDLFGKDLYDDPIAKVLIGYFGHNMPSRSQWEKTMNDRFEALMGHLSK